MLRCTVREGIRETEELRGCAELLIDVLREQPGGVPISDTPGVHQCHGERLTEPTTALDCTRILRECLPFRRRRLHRLEAITEGHRELRDVLVQLSPAEGRRITQEREHRAFCLAYERESAIECLSEAFRRVPFNARNMETIPSAVRVEHPAAIVCRRDQDVAFRHRAGAYGPFACASTRRRLVRMQTESFPP